MTPGARVQAAIEVLDAIAGGMASEKALLSWARGARYAGSKDRAAVRDHVFDAVRRWRSTAHRGGAETGRGRMLGLLRQEGQEEGAVFTGVGHAPAPLSEAERGAGSVAEGYAAWDVPDWIGARLSADLGPEAAAATARSLRHRAPVFLRVNTLRATREGAIARLAEEGIAADAHPLSPTALRIGAGARRVAQSATFREGWVELQDAASQAVVDALPLRPGMRVLDFCAGGGGKALAMAARLGGSGVTAHDANPARLADLPARAARAGVTIPVETRPAGGFDLVLADVPCSGSGAWRRAPDGKWRLSEAHLAAYCATQREILAQCLPLLRPGGVLAYATCSLFDAENEAQAARFAAEHPGWALTVQMRPGPPEGADGLFLACFSRRTGPPFNPEV